MILRRPKRLPIFPSRGFVKSPFQSFSVSPGQMAETRFCSFSTRAAFSGESTTMSLGSVSRWTSYSFFTTVRTRE